MTGPGQAISASMTRRPRHGNPSPLGQSLKERSPERAKRGEEPGDRFGTMFDSEPGPRAVALGDPGFVRPR